MWWAGLHIGLGKHFAPFSLVPNRGFQPLLSFPACPAVMPSWHGCTVAGRGGRAPQWTRVHWPCCRTWASIASRWAGLGLQCMVTPRAAEACLGSMLLGMAPLSAARQPHLLAVADQCVSAPYFHPSVALSPPSLCPACRARQAEQALRTFNNSLNAATSWLLNLGALAAAAPQPASGGGQAAAGSEQARGEGQPAAAEPQQAESGDESDGTPSVHSSGGSDGSDEEGGQPEGGEQVPGLASDGGSSGGSDDEEEAQPQRQAVQARQPALGRQEGEDDLPGLNSEGSDGGS